jgi:hypothetical protein
MKIFTMRWICFPRSQRLGKFRPQVFAQDENFKMGLREKLGFESANQFWPIQFLETNSASPQLIRTITAFRNPSPRCATSQTKRPRTVIGGIE